MWRVGSLEKTLMLGGRDWRQEEKGTTEDEMAGWHHGLNGCESEWSPGVGDGQGGLACCDSWGCKESDMTEWLNWTEPGHPDTVLYTLVSQIDEKWWKAETEPCPGYWTGRHCRISSLLKFVVILAIVNASTYLDFSFKQSTRCWYDSCACKHSLGDSHGHTDILG